MVPIISISNRSGFTLVEVLIAMFIVLVGLLGLLQSINVAIEHNMKNHLREEATRIGEREMVTFRATTATGTLVRRYPSALVPGRTFTVTRSSAQTGSATTRELEIIVDWNLKNVPGQHRVKSVRSQ